MALDAGTISSWLSTQPDPDNAVAFVDTIARSLDNPVPGGKMHFAIPGNVGDILNDLVVTATIPALDAAIRVVTDASGVRRAIPAGISGYGIDSDLDRLDPRGLSKLIETYSLLAGNSKLLWSTPELESVWRRLEKDPRRPFAYSDVDVTGQESQTLMLPLRFDLTQLPYLPLKALYGHELRVQLQLSTGNVLDPAVTAFDNPAFVPGTSPPRSVLPEDMDARYRDLRAGSLDHNTVIDASVALLDGDKRWDIAYTPAFRWAAHPAAPLKLALRRNCAYRFVDSECVVDRLGYQSPGGAFSDVYDATKYVYDGSAGQTASSVGDIIVRASMADLQRRPYVLTLYTYSTASPSTTTWGFQSALTADHVEFLALMVPGRTFRALDTIYTVTTTTTTGGRVFVEGTSAERPAAPSPGSTLEFVVLDDPRTEVAVICSFAQVGKVLVWQDQRTPLALDVSRTGTNDVYVEPAAGCRFYFPTFGLVQGSPKMLNFKLTNVRDVYRLAIEEQRTTQSNWMDFQYDASATSVFFYSSELRAASSAVFRDVHPTGGPAWMQGAATWTDGNYLTAVYRKWDDNTGRWGDATLPTPSLVVCGVPGDNVHFDYGTYQPDMRVYQSDADGGVLGNHPDGLFPPFFPDVTQPRLGTLPDDRPSLPVYQYRASTLDPRRLGEIEGRYEDVVVERVAREWKFELMIGIAYVNNPVRLDLDMPVVTPTLLQVPFAADADVVRVTLPPCGIAKELVFVFSRDALSTPTRDCFETCTLKLNGQPLLQPARTPRYFRSYLPFRHHRYVPESDEREGGVYVLPFTDVTGRGGGLDLMSFHSVVLEFATRPAVRGTMNLYILTTNVLSIKGGIARLKFAY